jgi:hypothetical protein
MRYCDYGRLHKKSSRQWRYSDVCGYTVHDFRVCDAAHVVALGGSGSMENGCNESE